MILLCEERNVEQGDNQKTVARGAKLDSTQGTSKCHFHLTILLESS